MAVYLDTNIVIYAVAHHIVFGPKVQSRLAAARAAGDALMISDLTRMECLVGPLKLGDAAAQGDFRLFFGVTSVVGITPGVCDRAAGIRATQSFKPMDALHLAAAIEHGAGTFLTNDSRLSRFVGLRVEVLS